MSEYLYTEGLSGEIQDFLQYSTERLMQVGVSKLLRLLRQSEIAYQYRFFDGLPPEDLAESLGQVEDVFSAELPLTVIQTEDRKDILALSRETLNKTYSLVKVDLRGHIYSGYVFPLISVDGDGKIVYEYSRLYKDYTHDFRSEALSRADADALTSASFDLAEMQATLRWRPEYIFDDQD